MDHTLDISSVLQGGYAHPLTRELQAERQLTKYCQITTLNVQSVT
jgi:porphobilinogen synthase